MNDLSCGIRIWSQISFVLSQIARLTDGRTDRQTDNFIATRPAVHSMQRGKSHSTASCWSIVFPYRLVLLLLALCPPGLRHLCERRHLSTLETPPCNCYYIYGPGITYHSCSRRRAASARSIASRQISSVTLLRSRDKCLDSWSPSMLDCITGCYKQQCITDVAWRLRHFIIARRWLILHDELHRYIICQFSSAR